MSYSVKAYMDGDVPTIDDNATVTKAAETMIAVGKGHLLDHGQRVFVDFDNIVKKTDSPANPLSQPLPVYPAILDEFRKIDRAKVAAFVGKERNLSARVCGLNPPDFWSWIAAVNLVQEDKAWVS